MRLPLDTHAFLWWLAGDEMLSVGAREDIGEEQDSVFVSAASVWEISTKHRSGKLPGASSIAGDLAGAIESQRFVSVSITIEHAQAAGALPGPHRDPFDRMLIAQAILEGAALLSNEALFDTHGVNRLW